MATKDALADRCKRFESAEAGRRAMPGIPLLARLDGRAFHTFTRGLARPWDERLATCMVETTRVLVDDLQALVGYTQSDEITLLWSVPAAGPTDYPFDGRFQKLASIASGLASAAFTRLVAEHLPEKSRSLPSFDARVWQVPSREDAVDVFTWREDDATKNSLSMAARALYSHSELHGKNGPELHDLLHARGVNWNDYAARFKRGAYLRRERFARALSDAELGRIPEAHRPAPDFTAQRSEVRVFEMPPIRRVRNVVETLFEGAPPVER
jgi:tRNA(His) 5'-end guanylyltransferase